MASTDYGLSQDSNVNQLLLSPAPAVVQLYLILLKLKFLYEAAHIVLKIRYLTSVNISKLCLIKIIWQFKKWHLPLRQKRQTI